jgi:hypothetical protein
MFDSDNNINMLWETLTESVVILNNSNINTIKTKFTEHVRTTANNSNNLKLNDINKKFINEFITIYKEINVPQKSFQSLMEEKQSEFTNLIQPKKPNSINISDPVYLETQSSITEKLKQYQQMRNNDTLLNYETPLADAVQTPVTIENVGNTFMNKLKIENTPVEIQPINISKKVSFVEDPTDSDMKKNDVLVELREIKRRVSKLINLLETTEIVV